MCQLIKNKFLNEYFQMAIENIHSETYSLLIDTYFKDPVEKSEALDAINHMPCIKDKADWCFKWIDNKDAPFSLVILLVTLSLNVLFRMTMQHDNQIPLMGLNLTPV